jgi:hypothetical protein
MLKSGSWSGVVRSCNDAGNPDRIAASHGADTLTAGSEPLFCRQIAEIQIVGEAG